MSNDIKRGPIANCIALHDFANIRPNLKEWIHYIIEFFNSHNITPSKMDISGENGIKGRSNILFSNGIKRLEASNYEGVDGIWIGALPQKYGTEMLDFIFMVRIILEPKRTSCVLCFDDNITPFEHDNLNKLAKDLASFFKAQYGYCYQRDFDKGPGFYPIGVIVGLEYGHPERALITEWARKYRRHDGTYKTGT